MGVSAVQRMILATAIVAPAASWAAPGPCSAFAASEEARPAATQRPRPAKRKRVIPDLSGFDVVSPGMPGLGFTALGGTRGRPAPVPLAPRLGKVFGTKILLSWSYPYLGGKFALRVEQGGEVVYSGQATGNSFVLAAEDVPVAPGRTYYWAVEPAATAGKAEAAAGFQVLAGAERTEVETALGNIGSRGPVRDGLARAQVFTDRRIWYDALAVLSDLIVRFPREPEPHEQRGLLLSQFEWTKPAAEVDFAHSDALRE